jgi:hypothetical protein
MALHKLSAVGFYILLAVACTSGDTKDTDPIDTGAPIDTDTTDTDTTDTDTPEDTDITPSWDTTSFDITMAMMTDCTSVEEGTVSFMIRSDNWGYTPELYIADTRFSKDYDELHTLAETDTSPLPTGYSFFERELTAGALFANATPDVNTVIGCRDFDATSAEEYSVGVALALFDEAGDLADCIVFGYDTDVLFNGELSGGQISQPAWLTEANCRVVGE